MRNAIKQAAAKRRWYDQNKEKARRNANEYVERNRDLVYSRHRRITATLRLAIVRRFGGKCRICGFDDHRELCVDHKNGGGGIERRGLHPDTYYRRLLTASKSKYQLLCANCNLIKARRRGELSRRGDNL